MAANVSDSDTALAAIARFESRNWVTKLISGAVLGLVVGTVLGSLLFHLLATDTTVTALIRITEPPDLIAVAGGARQATPILPDNTERYVAGEVAYLSADGFAQAVAARLGKSKPPELKAVQEGRSSVVSITNTSDSRDDAMRAVQMAIDVYAQQVAGRTDRELQIVLPRLIQWEKTADPADAPKIRQLRDQVSLEAVRSGQILVLQPPTADYVSAHRSMIGVLLGGFLGAAAVPLILFTLRKRSTRLSVCEVQASSSILTDTVDNFLIPVVDLRLPPRGDWGEEQAALGRTLYTQLAAVEEGRRVVVIAASSSSGASVVASLLELGAVGSRPVRLITAPVDEHDAATIYIIDVGAVGANDAVAQAIASATDLVLVARLGADTVAHLHVVRSATAASDAPLHAIFTSLPWWDFGRNAKRQLESQSDSSAG